MRPRRRGQRRDSAVWFPSVSEFALASVLDGLLTIELFVASPKVTATELGY
jgi:hypothetical protein